MVLDISIFPGMTFIIIFTGTSSAIRSMKNCFFFFYKRFMTFPEMLEVVAMFSIFKTGQMKLLIVSMVLFDYIVILGCTSYCSSLNLVLESNLAIVTLRQPPLAFHGMSWIVCKKYHSSQNIRQQSDILEKYPQQKNKPENRHVKNHEPGSS